MRPFTTVVAALYLVAPIGCAMCASPYDECGPTFSGECGDYCDFNYREGSILGGAVAVEAIPEDAVLEPELEDAPIPTPAPEPYTRRSIGSDTPRIAGDW